MVISICKWFLLPALLLVNRHTGDMHPLYVSVTEINHNAAEKSVEISCKMFTDDLENTINRIYKTNIDLSAPKDSVKAGMFLADYVKKHLVLKADGRLADLKLIGFERESGALWSYFEAGNIVTVKHLDIANDLLYEFYDTQIGIMHVTAGGKRKSTKLNRPDKNTVFDF